MLVLENVSKSYGSKKVLDGLSLELRRGEIVGFVGLNGSGKTTTMRCILGIAAIGSGSVNILHDSGEKAPVQKKDFGYMPEERGLFQNETVEENLKYLGELRGLSRRSLEARIKMLLEDFEIGDLYHSKLKNLSLGNQQRIQLIATIVHNPHYLLLDEPFNGLDPRGTVQVTRYLQEMAKNGTGILFSSHILGHVKYICDRAIVLSNGKIEMSFIKNNDLQSMDGQSLTDFYFEKVINEQD
ncbi:MAG: ABC transporter ATP-binding protein [Candidatus Planktophila sp.]